MRMFLGAIGIATLLIVSHSLAEISDGTELQMKFLNMPEKRDLTSALANDDFSKRAPMGFQGMRGKKDDMELDVKENLLVDDFEKRAPMGFQGMRGKKNDLVTPDLDEAFYNDEYEKRAPMGFQGMRGKKTMVDDEFYKRAMTGFQGMRGKKSLEEIYDDMEKRNDIELQEVISDNMYMNKYPENFDKRAMSMGFQGMRGKKNDYDSIKEWEEHTPADSYYDAKDSQYMLEPFGHLVKRAIMGFQGMRGKKGNMKRYYYGVPRYPKRASMGFVGMRGKRNVALQDSRLDNNLMEFDKRTPYGFFGMRGKKIPRWEIRGKFIGVRGKKNSPDNLNNIDNPIYNGFDNIERVGLKSGTTNIETQ